MSTHHNQRRTQMPTTRQGSPTGTRNHHTTRIRTQTPTTPPTVATSPQHNTNTLRTMRTTNPTRPTLRPWPHRQPHKLQRPRTPTLQPPSRRKSSTPNHNMRATGAPPRTVTHDRRGGAKNVRWGQNFRGLVQVLWFLVSFLFSCGWREAGCMVARCLRGNYG